MRKSLKYFIFFCIMTSIIFITLGIYFKLNNQFSYQVYETSNQQDDILQSADKIANQLNQSLTYQRGYLKDGEVIIVDEGRIGKW